MKCSICGTDNEDGVGFCRHCGVSIARTTTAAPAAATAICSTCGCRHAIPARFCDQCGSRVSANAVAAPAAASRGASAGRSGSQAASGTIVSPAPSQGPATHRSPARSAGDALMVPAASSASAMAVRSPSSFPSSFVKAAAGALSSLLRALQGRYRHHLDSGPKRRFWLLLTGAGLSVALILIGGFLVARTLMMGEPPWKAPQARKLPDPVLLAAAARRMEPLPGDAPQQTVAAPSAETGERNAPAELPKLTDTPPAADVASAAFASTETSAAETSAAESLPDLPPAAATSEPPAAPTEQRAEAERRTASRTADVARPAPPARHASPAAVRPGPSASGASSGTSDGPAMAENDESEAVARALLPEQNKARKQPAPPVRNEPRPARVAQAPAQQNWYVAMKSQLNRCADDPNVFTRVICAEQAKFRYCSPNRWGQVAECVKTQYRDISTINEKSGRGVALSRHDRTG